MSFPSVALERAAACSMLVFSVFHRKKFEFAGAGK